MLTDRQPRQIGPGMMTDYNLICEQMEGLAKIDHWYLPVLSNASALLFTQMPGLNWAGFYLARGMN